MFNFDFNTVPQWGWVTIAWTQLILSYIGYLGYLQHRENKLRQHIQQQDINKIESEQQ